MPSKQPSDGFKKAAMNALDSIDLIERDIIRQEFEHVVHSMEKEVRYFIQNSVIPWKVFCEKFGYPRPFALAWRIQK